MSKKTENEQMLDKIEGCCSVLSNIINKTEKDIYDFSKISLEFRDRITNDYRNAASYIKDWFTRYIYFKDDQMVLITGQVLRNRHDRIHTALYQHERSGEAHLYQSNAKKCLSCCSVDGINYEYRILATRLKKAKYEERLENIANVAESCGEKIEIITGHLNKTCIYIEDAFDIHYRKLKTLFIGQKLQKLEINTEPYLGEVISGSCYQNNSNHSISCGMKENSFFNLEYHRKNMKSITTTQARSTTIEDYGDLNVRYQSRIDTIDTIDTDQKQDSSSSIMKFNVKALNRKIIDVEELEEVKKQKEKTFKSKGNMGSSEDKYEFLNAVNDIVGLSTEFDQQDPSNNMEIDNIHVYASSASRNSIAHSMDVAGDVYEEVELDTASNYFVETNNCTVDYLWKMKCNETSIINNMDMDPNIIHPIGNTNTNTSNLSLGPTNPIMYFRIQYPYINTHGYRYKNELGDKLFTAILDTRIHMHRLPSVYEYMPLKCDILLDILCEDIWNYHYHRVKWDPLSNSVTNVATSNSNSNPTSTQVSIHRIALFPISLWMHNEKYNRGDMLEFQNNYIYTNNNTNTTNNRERGIEKWIPRVHKVYCNRKNELFLKILMEFSTGLDQYIYNSEDFFIPTLFHSLSVFLQELFIQPLHMHNMNKIQFTWCRTSNDTKLDFRCIKYENDIIKLDENEYKQIDKSNIPEKHVCYIKNSKCMLLYKFLCCVQNQCIEYVKNERIGNSGNSIGDGNGNGVTNNIVLDNTNNTSTNTNMCNESTSDMGLDMYPFMGGFDCSNTYLDQDSKQIFDLFSVNI